MDRAEARVMVERIKHAEAELSLNREREKEMIVRSPTDGRVVLATPRDLVGKFLRKGNSIGYVADLDDPTVRVVVPQSAIDLVRDRTRDIRVRFADRFEEVRPATMIHEIPFVSDKLPSAAFSTQGGGQISVNPSEPDGMTALEMLYQLELKVDKPLKAAGVGSRVYVRFGHGEEPLAYQVYRQIRQMFLKRFSV